jgi:hypothetical protein
MKSLFLTGLVVLGLALFTCASAQSEFTPPAGKGA